MRNPLNKRVPRELIGDWHKYIVIIVFMVFMIGVVSAMYVGHDSMVLAIENTKAVSNLEDGRFETDMALSEQEIEAIETGELADVRKFYYEEGYREADKEVAKESVKALKQEVEESIESTVRQQCSMFGITDEATIKEQIDKAISENYDEALKQAKESQEYKDAIEEATQKAYEEVEKKVDEEWDKTVERYKLDEEGFSPVSVSVIPHFYKNEDEDQNDDGTRDATIRVFKSDSEVDLATFNEGRAPKTTDEIAIDRMHADNVGLEIGDTITLGRREFEIVGLLSYVNYTTLHENNTDLMFDAFGFDVGMVTPETFELLDSHLHYNYVFMYDKKPQGDVEKADSAEAFMKALITQLAVTDTKLEDFVPEYMNQSSNFAPSDIEGDTAGAAVLVYILIGVIAFIFAITISTTIDKEASVIGTLRASGYTRGELTRHYMTMPIIVTLIGAIIGNAMGYTVFKNIVVDLYYNSYSLPKCETVWSTTAFVKTTLIPLVLMLFINLFVIKRKLRLSPLKFLRHDLKKVKREKAIRLPAWSFIRRFRLRIMLQNIPNYLILVFGIVFVEIMLCFAFGFPDSLKHYADMAPDMMLTPYQYTLLHSTDEDGNEITTKTDGVERFNIITLEQNRMSDSKPMRGASKNTESISVYGYYPDSKYILIEENIPEGNVFISTSYASKYRLSVGEKITLSERYENKNYSFRISGIYEYDGGLAVFMPKAAFDEVFDREDDDFSGYFSDEEITDIDEKYIANVLTSEDVAKISNQLMHSMGGFMDVFKYALLAMSISLIYLLSKIIIEKNENSISMSKILGFKNGEIAGLYMLPTAILVVIFTGISLFIGKAVIEIAFEIFMMQMDGWFTFWMSPKGMIGSIIFILIGYTVVSVFDYRRIRRIPMEDALKNIE